MKYKLSIIWNWFAFLVIETGIKLIWDLSGKNDMFISDMKYSVKEARSILSHGKIMRYYKKIMKVRLGFKHGVYVGMAWAFTGCLIVTLLSKHYG